MGLQLVSAAVAGAASEYGFAAAINSSSKAAMGGWACSWYQQQWQKRLESMGLQLLLTAAARRLGHVGRMEEGRLPHIALFSSLHGDMTRPVGRPRHTWEKCVCADLKVLGQDEGSWEASCQIKSAWRKRLWDLTHPWESQRLVRCRRRTKQAIDKHVERYVMPFSGWEDGGSPVPRWWEPPPAPTRVVLDPAASPPPMCDGSGAGFGF